MSGSASNASDASDAQPIDAIQTARDSGDSVMSIARRFEVSRMTVWEKTARAAGLSSSDAP
jgi:transposase-like protein